jgi:hypothetical protein
MPRAHNTDSAALKSIQAKRAAVTPKRLRKRAEAGEDITGKRAIVRMGTLNTRILTGQENLDDWDDEELKHGQRKDKNGRFQGSSPVIVPKQLHNELVRRTLSKIEELMRESAYEAAQALVEIMQGAYTEDKDDPKAKDRIKAAEIILNRVLGKEPIRLEVQAIKSKYEEAFEAMIVPDDEYDDAIDVDSWEE